MVPRRMGNVLDDQTQHDVRALGRLGWTLSRIAAAKLLVVMKTPLVTPWPVIDPMNA